MFEHLQLVITLAAGGITALMTILLGIIIYELRALRKDLKDCVPDKMCRTMMKAHEHRITELERKKKVC